MFTVYQNTLGVIPDVLEPLGETKVVIFYRDGGMDTRKAERLLLPDIWKILNDENDIVEMVYKIKKGS